MNFEKGSNIVIIFLLISTVSILAYNWIDEKPENPNKCDVFPPDSKNPICLFDSIVLNKSIKYIISIPIFNNQNLDIQESAEIFIDCNSNAKDEALLFDFSSDTQFIKKSGSFIYKAKLKILEESPSGIFSCNLKLSNMHKPFLLTIND